MSWLEIEGHDEIVERFRIALQNGRIGGAYLFTGTPGIGKKSFALRLAQALLCEQTSDKELDACGKCAACQQVLAESHPDLDIIRKHPDRNIITVDLLIGDKQHRMREGLCPRIAMKPASGKRKIAIIDDAELLGIEGANCLLKTLEEPPPGSVLILIAPSAQTQLPTIRSRCQTVRFQPLSAAFLAQRLEQSGVAENHDEAVALAARCGGSLARTDMMANPEMGEYRRELISTLAKDAWNSTQLADSIHDFLKEEKDVSAKRERLRWIIDVAIEFYRELLRAVAGLEVSNDALVNENVSRRSISFVGDQQSLVECLERCMDTRIQVTANVNLSTCVDAWIDDLAHLARP